MATIQERLEAMRNGAPPVGKMSVSKTDDINTRLNAMRQDGAKFQNPLMDLAMEKVAQNSNGYVSMADLNRESNGAGTEVQRKAPVDLGMPAIIAPKDMTPTMPHHSGKFDEPSTLGWRYGEIADDAQRYAAAMAPTSDMYLNPYTADAASFMQSEADKALADAAYYREKENSENKALEDQRKTTNQAFRAVDTFTPLESGAWINSPEQYDTAQRMYDQAAAEDAKLKAMGGRAARELPLTVPKNFFAGVVGAARGLVNEAGYIAQGATKAQMDENAEMWRRMGREDYARDMEKARDAQGDMQNWAQFGQPYISSVAEETAGYGKGGQILGNVAQGVGGMVPSILSNLAVPGSGLPVMFFQASGNATEEAKAAGASDEAAALYGTAVGAVEVLTEKMFGGIPGLNIGALDEGIENIIKQKVGNEAAQRAIVFLVDALGEGVEEFTSEFGDYFLDKWLVKHDDRSLNEVGKDALYSFLIGTLTSVAMQAPAEVANMAKTRRGREQLAQIVADQVEQQIEQPNAAQNATQPAVNEPLMQLAQEMAAEQITAARDAELRAQAAMTAQNAQAMQAAIPAQQTAPASEIQPQNANAAAQETLERQTAPATQAEEPPAQAQKKPAVRANNPGFVQDAVSDRAKLTYTQKRALDTIGKVLGVRVRMVESISATDADGNVRQSGAQGYYKNGEIVLARDADDPYLTTAVHESVHRIRELSEGDYSYLAGFVQRNMSDPKYKLAELIKGMEGYTAENIPEEIVADAFGRMLGDEQTMRQFVAENSTAAQRIMDVFAEIFDRIRQALTGGNVKTLTDNQRKVYEDLAGRLDVMMKYYQDAIDAAKASGGPTQNNSKQKFSLRSVSPAEPTSNQWKRGATYDEVKAVHPTLYELSSEEQDTRNPTQISGTVKTYRKIYDALQSEGFDGTILDASSGLGVGTQAGRDEYGFDVDDIEPFPDKSYTPKYTDYSKLNKQYDVVISNAVLNVLPQDLRDAMVVKIGELMAPGGRAFINVRGDDVKNAKSKIAIDEDGMEYFIADGASYQKGFKKPELKAYLEDVLGDGYTVDPKGGFGGVSVVVRKDDAVGYPAERAVGIHVDDASESAAPTGAKLSRRSFLESDYVQDRETAAKGLSERLGISVAKANRYIDSVNSVAKMIADDRVRLDYESSPGRSSFVGNTEYGGSIDFSTVCKKRRLYTGTIDAIQRAMPDKALTADEMLKIRAEMKKRGYEVSCGLCYVEGSRVNIGKYTQEFLDELKGTDMYVPTMAEINTTDGQERLRAEHPEVYDQYVKFMNKLAQRKPKLFQMATEYQGEILKKFKNDSTVEQKNRNGGLRLQSFSDFEIIHLIDCMQVIMDMSRVGLAGQAYTKVPDFAWALGDTGLKINLSMIAKGVDPQGRIIYDEVEGMKHADARKLRDRYSKNVGTILVVFNDAQLKAALNDSFVDFIIPFHRSQWNKGQYEMLGLPAGATDYTMQQNESYLDGRKNANGKTVRPDNFMPNEYWDFDKTGKENAETYLRMCAEDGRRPKFYKLLVDNGDGSFSLQPDGSTDGYWKLLTDFKMYDNDGNGSPQMPVRPDFNMDEAERMLSTYEGGHAKFPAAQDVVDDFVSGKFSRSDRESADRVMAKRDADYSAAVERGDMETAQRMVDEAAKAAGYPLKLMHGTNSFGFTSIEYGEGDDNISFWATDSEEVAASYVRPMEDEPNTYVRSIGKPVKNRISMASTVPDILSALKSGDSTLYSDYRQATQNDIDRTIMPLMDDAKDAAKALDGYGGLPDDIRSAAGKIMAATNVRSAVEAFEPVKNSGDIYYNGEYFYGANREMDRLRSLIDHLDRLSSLTPENTAAAPAWEYGGAPRLITKSDLYDQYLDVSGLSGRGIYEIYTTYNNPLVVRCGGHSWNRIRPTGAMANDLGDTATTRDIVKWAHDNGYGTVLFEDVKDTGAYGSQYTNASNVYAFLEGGENLFKSADPVTYDDNGNVIPLSERFNPENEDIRYSTSDRELLDEYIKAHGAIKTGENPTRDITMPKRTTPKTKMSMTVRTVAEAGATPDEFIPTIENLAANHEFDYTPYSDEAAIGNAAQYIEKRGYQSALDRWTKDVSSGEVSKTNTAIGWALYNNAVSSGDTYNALKVLRNIVQHQRNAAQAVQATRILKQLNPETQLYNAEQTVASLQDELKKKYGDKAPDLEIDPDLAERFLKAKTPEARDKAMQDIYRDIGRQMPTRFIDRWNAWRYLAMLGNPRTHIRNIVGNAGFAPVVAAKNLTATAIESAVNLVSGGKIERTKGNIIGRGDLMKAAWADYENVRGEALGEGKYNERQIADKEIEDARRIFGNTKSKVWNKTGGAALEWARKANGTALDAEDVWFSKPHYTMALAQYCAANGISAEQISKGQGLAKARAYAIKEAQKATYRDTNDFSQAISRLGRGAQWSQNKVTRAISTVMEGILPFRKTPANILARGVEYSPIGLLKSLTYDLAQVQNGNMSAADMIDNLSAGLTGTGLVALGAYLVSQGLLRGRGGSDDKKKDFDKLTGHQNYALELPNGTSITLDWLAPEALPLFIGANLAEIAKENNGNMKLADILTAVGNVTEPMLEMSCLQSLNNIFQAVGYAKEGDMNALTSALASAATSYLTQALPTLLGQVERTGEDKRMTTYTDKNDFLTGDIQYTLGKASARLPVWDYHQIPYIDAWGREELTGKPIARGFNNFFNPSFVSKINESDMEKELERLYDSTGENVFPQRAPKYFNVDGERKDLTAGEYLKYATAKGQTSYAVVGGMTSSSIYENMTDDEKAACVEDAYSYANQTARTTVGGKVSDSWVEKAQTGVKHGIAPETYIMLRNITGDIDSLKDKNGDTISNSKGLQIMEKIYSIHGLNDEQRQYLFESFGVGKTILHYNKAAVSEKLSQMRKQ